MEGCKSFIVLMLFQARLLELGVAGGRPGEADLSSPGGRTVEGVGGSIGQGCVAVTVTESGGSRAKL